MNPLNYNRFQSCLFQLGASVEAEEQFETLKNYYTEEFRFYHNADHIQFCLQRLDDFLSLASVDEHPEFPDLVEAAIWFHDTIYDSRANDNEEKSAELAEKLLSELRAKSEYIKSIKDIILATKPGTKSHTKEQKLISDIDLLIFAQPKAIFDSYEKAIRREYSWVTDKDFKSGRLKVLQNFADREFIYHNSWIRERHEQAAKSNLQCSISALISEK